MTKQELATAVKEFLALFRAAPQFGSYSRITKQRIQSKQQLRDAFVEDLKMMSVLSDEEVTVSITSIIGKMEKLL